MDDALAGIAIVLALIGLIVTLSLAHEVGALRAALGNAPLRPAASMPRVLGGPAPTAQALSRGGSPAAVPPAPNSLLIFTLAGCAPCELLLADVVSTELLRKIRVPVLVLERAYGANEGSRHPSLDGITVDEPVAGRMADLYEINAYPQLVLVIAGKVMSYQMATKADDLTRLAAQIGAIDRSTLAPATTASTQRPN